MRAYKRINGELAEYTVTIGGLAALACEGVQVAVVSWTPAAMMRGFLQYLPRAESRTVWSSSAVLYRGARFHFLCPPQCERVRGLDLMWLVVEDGAEVSSDWYDRIRRPTNGEVKVEVKGGWLGGFDKAMRTFERWLAEDEAKPVPATSCPLAAAALGIKTQENFIVAPVVQWSVTEAMAQSAITAKVNGEPVGATIPAGTLKAGDTLSLRVTSDGAGPSADAPFRMAFEPVPKDILDAQRELSQPTDAIRGYNLQWMVLDELIDPRALLREKYERHTDAKLMRLCECARTSEKREVAREVWTARMEARKPKPPIRDEWDNLPDAEPAWGGRR